MPETNEKKPQTQPKADATEPPPKLVVLTDNLDEGDNGDWLRVMRTKEQRGKKPPTP